MEPYIKTGWGFDVDVNFARATEDTPIELAPDEPAKPQFIVGYIAGHPEHPRTFMRYDRVRVHVQKRAVANLE